MMKPVPIGRIGCRCRLGFSSATVCDALRIGRRYNEFASMVLTRTLRRRL
jgi:hypothetical protein